MTEETNTEVQAQPEQQPDSNGVNISIEQILAATLKTVGEVNIKVEDLIANYGDKSIAVNQQEDKSVTFSLVDAPEPTEVEDTTETAE
jgi:hypothetical protein